MKRTILVTLLTVILQSVAAQQLMPLPVDTAVRYGKLPNGLTYIIRHNANPEHRADFYIAQKVGSVLEEEEQRGLAHFLEHMAFNGSQHFPGKSMLNYLERNGVKFGTDLNAYTSFDQTVYNIINVPVDKSGIVDSCLYILYDWSTAIALEDEEIDNERGVIHEEWRTRNNASMRILETILPEVLAGSRYAERMPIGKMEVVMNFPYDDLRAYYKKWYRPDQQGLIIVGDINAAEVEQKIIDMFGSIQLPQPLAERPEYTVPANDEPIIAIATDKEAGENMVSLYCKHKSLPAELASTIIGLQEDYCQAVAQYVLSERLNEIARKPGAPIIAAGVEDGDMIARSQKAFMVNTLSKEGQSAAALKLIAEETERYRRYGITPGEYDRAVSSILAMYQKAYNERDKRDNSSYTKEYINYFLSGGYIMNISDEYEAIKQVAATTSYEKINEYIKNHIAENNRVAIITGIEKDGVTYPTKDEAAAILQQATRQELHPYNDESAGKSLIENEPQPGMINETKYDAELQITRMKLSNGAEVILKPTDYKSDEIILNAVSKGGNLLYGEEDILNLRTFNDIVEISKWGGHTNIELNKMMAGKHVALTLSLINKREIVNGMATVKDLETMMQLLYLAMTDITRDDEAFAVWKSNAEEQLRNIDAKPKTALSDTIVQALYKGNPRKENIKAADIEKIEYDRVLQIWKERYGNAADFTFIFTGNIDTAQIIPYIEKYIASLPSAKKHDKIKNDKVGLRQAPYTNNFEREMQNISGTVYIAYTGKSACTTEDRIKMNMFKQIMDIVYTSTIREDEGGTYGVRTSVVWLREEGEWAYIILFDTNVQDMERLKERTIAELQKVIQEGPSQTNFNKVKEYMLKADSDNQRKNRYWAAQLAELRIYGKTDILKYADIIEKQTPQTIKDYIGKLFTKSSKIEVMMRGVEPATK